jgi:Cytochrome oxidase complex assembly protein 1
MQTNNQSRYAASDLATPPANGWNKRRFLLALRRTTIWGLVACGLIVACFAALVGGVFYVSKRTEPYKLAVARLEQSAEAVALFGGPVSGGMPTKSSFWWRPRGDNLARLEIDIDGPNGRGKAFAEAKQELGSWRLACLEVQGPSSDRRVAIIECTAESSPEREQPIESGAGSGSAGSPKARERRSDGDSPL